METVNKRDWTKGTIQNATSDMWVVGSCMVQRGNNFEQKIGELFRKADLKNLRYITEDI